MGFVVEGAFVVAGFCRRKGSVAGTFVVGGFIVVKVGRWHAIAIPIMVLIVVMGILTRTMDRTTDNTTPSTLSEYLLLCSWQPQSARSFIDATVKVSFLVCKKQCGNRQVLSRLLRYFNLPSIYTKLVSDDVTLA